MAVATLARPQSLWHEGEIKLQRSVGVAERMGEIGSRVIRDHLVDQHRQFYPLLPFVVLGAVDPEGEVWATMRAGHEGFLSSPDPKRLHIELPRDPADPADRGMGDGDALALLGIDLRTRRRNRVNGTIRRAAASGFDLAVEQSFGNCPQYIQRREFGFVRDPAEPAAAPPQTLDGLDQRAWAMIAGADTFFVASYVDRPEGRQVDISHRGGRAGFVRIGADGVLAIPDFAGNLFFNTLGNFLVNPKAGLLFVDFATGDMLQLAGTPEVILESPEIAAFQGAERLWRFTPRHIVYRPAALPLRWAFKPEGWSPNALMTGNWDEAAGRLKAAELAQSWRQFRIANIARESNSIRSFHLEPLDGAGLIRHEAGQHLPIRVTPAGAAAPVLRTYTLSTAPSDNLYRISVKRDGVVSRHLHGLKVGDVIEARAPAGQFTIDAAEHRPAVLIAAGIGITPMLSMLRHIVYEGLRTRQIRPTWLFYAAHSKAERAFDREIAALVDTAPGVVELVRVLSDPTGAVEKLDYDESGRIDVDLLRARLPFDDYDFYLCGPPLFMQAVYDGLRGLNIADARIHAEAFGPASMQRTPDPGAVPKPTRAPAQEPVPVVFAKTAKEARWTPESGTLLELAEARGLSPAFSCRAGSCGSCRTRVLEGAVSYKTEPTAEVGADEALICCAVPASPEDGGGARLQLDL
ncbi:MAG TPA: pyridoxamine 5'-phosphate oxidase family protein [Aliidongia sp.]|nr:pyridoxamine 5'-phosphate oxidase family protein [Aliidongia sp.]